MSPDVVDDLSEAVGRRRRDLDPMLPTPRDVANGCMAPFVVAGANGRPAGVGVCRHRHIPDDALEQVWGTMTRLELTPGLPEPDIRASRVVGLVNVQPPGEAAWIAFMTRPGPAAYLRTMFVRPDERSVGLGAALVKRAHDELDARGVSATLLHYAQLNPLSAPFWHRTGYRPLWTSWEARPASALR